MDPSPRELEVEDVTFLDVDLYKAAVAGEIEAFNDYKGSLGCLVTPDKNTVLHVHLAIQRHKFRVFHIYSLENFTRFRASTLRSTKFVEHLLNDCPSLLLQANAKGEIPLHIEARYGHCPTVKLLLERAKLAQQGDAEKGLEAVKEMLRKRDNKEENTPLHIAARYGNLEVVRALVEAEPDFEYPANKNGETPLYIAARRGYHLLVAEMLNICKSVDHAGPKGMTSLHAAVMANHEETVRIIINKKKILANKTDDNGRSPLHFAAHLGWRSIVKQLLECDKSTAYIADLEGKMTALHVAARQGHASIMKDIIRYCPDCCELVDKRGWNFLHFATGTLLGKSYAQFFGDDIGIEYASMENLLDQKDVHGNTPLQVLVTCRSLTQSKAMKIQSDKMELSKENLTMKEEQILKLLEEVGNGEMAGVSIRGFINYRRIPPGFEEAKNSQLVVVTLIATVTFAAAFTIPGGYKNESSPDQGTAILIRNAAFNIFVISNASAVVSSLLAVFFHFLMAWPYSQKRSQVLPVKAYTATIFAIEAMVIAFITGTFAVLETSLELAIPTCFIGLSFFLFAIPAFRRVFNYSE